MSYSIFVFDAYGTLFDVHAAVRNHIADIGPEGEQLSSLWRSRQLEYSWTRSLMGRYSNFWQLTEEALDFALSSFPNIDPSIRDKLLSSYMSLDTYPEVPAILKKLHDNGSRLAILSNGSVDMLESAVNAAGLVNSLDMIFSVDDIGKYKTDPSVYEMVTTHYRVFPEAISFQSANRWDIAGAKAFGFKTVWINRSQAVDEYKDLPPDAVLPNLEGLLAI